MAEYIGLTIKNNIRHNAIPEHSEASLATANGNANITTTLTEIQVMIILRLPIESSIIGDKIRHTTVFHPRQMIPIVI